MKKKLFEIIQIFLYFKNSISVNIKIFIYSLELWFEKRKSKRVYCKLLI